MRCLEIEGAFENLDPNDYDQTKVSPDTQQLQIGVRGKYNCIALAVCDEERWWWPDKRFPNDNYWPPHLQREHMFCETMENFIMAFETEGYTVCNNGRLDSGIEKIVIYARGDTPTHAARQLESGIWISKCGDLQDIRHGTLACLEGKNYGKAEVFMRRRRDGKAFLFDRIKAFLRSIFPARS